ncbi:plastocyanin [Nocardia sp. SYP-A9097]|uniref:cupredoxin domain-containing protein n=1 Tax=Nocardia sp. SYP-A9097 TaxID=2663237 RepID=UPI00129B534D|nr:cupredoxin family copper-binding protein [Nocardia sp. SYP-A9097]MRH89728.1 plastocyanin [Nocardia sp. SYP-A9097]
MRTIRVAGRAALAATAVATTLLSVSACGGGATPAATAPTPVFASGTDTPGMVPGGGGPVMPGMQGTSAPATTPVDAPAGPNAVTIGNFAFAPASLTVPVGTTVTWTNRDEEPHNVAAGDGGFHSPNLGAGATYTFTFTKAGTFTYICAIHPFMHGTVVVTA